MLVLAPTRELVQQIAAETRRCAPGPGSAAPIRVALAHGGDAAAACRKAQARVLRDGVEVLVGAPGRTLDFVRAGALCLRRATYVALDEADTCLSMGFELQVCRPHLSSPQPAADCPAASPSPSNPCLEGRITLHFSKGEVRFSILGGGQ